MNENEKDLTVDKREPGLSESQKAIESDPIACDPIACDVHPEHFNEDWDDMRKYLEELRQLIKSLANKKNPNIKVKHSWLRTKFNSMAKDFEKSEFKQLGFYDVPETEVHLFANSKIKPFE